MIKKAFAHLSENGGDENVSKMIWIAITFVVGAILLSLVTAAFNGPVTNWFNGVVDGWFGGDNGNFEQDKGACLVLDYTDNTTFPNYNGNIDVYLNGNWIAPSSTELRAGDILTLYYQNPDAGASITVNGTLYEDETADITCRISDFADRAAFVVVCESVFEYDAIGCETSVTIHFER